MGASPSRSAASVEHTSLPGAIHGGAEARRRARFDAANACYLADLRAVVARANEPALLPAHVPLDPSGEKKKKAADAAAAAAATPSPSAKTPTSPTKARSAAALTSPRRRVGGLFGSTSSPASERTVGGRKVRLGGRVAVGSDDEDSDVRNYTFDPWPKAAIELVVASGNDRVQLYTLPNAQSPHTNEWLEPHQVFEATHIVPGYSPGQRFAHVKGLRGWAPFLHPTRRKQWLQPTRRAISEATREARGPGSRPPLPVRFTCKTGSVRALPEPDAAAAAPQLRDGSGVVFDSDGACLGTDGELWLRAVAFDAPLFAPRALGWARFTDSEQVPRPQVGDAGPDSESDGEDTPMALRTLKTLKPWQRKLFRDGVYQCRDLDLDVVAADAAASAIRAVASCLVGSRLPCKFAAMVELLPRAVPHEEAPVDEAGEKVPWGEEFFVDDAVLDPSSGQVWLHRNDDPLALAAELVANAKGPGRPNDTVHAWYPLYIAEFETTYSAGSRLRVVGGQRGAVVRREGGSGWKTDLKVRWLADDVDDDTELRDAQKDAAAGKKDPPSVQHVTLDMATMAVTLPPEKGSKAEPETVRITEDCRRLAAAPITRSPPALSARFQVSGEEQVPLVYGPCRHAEATGSALNENEVVLVDGTAFDGPNEFVRCLDGEGDVRGWARARQKGTGELRIGVKRIPIEERGVSVRFLRLWMAGLPPAVRENLTTGQLAGGLELDGAEPWSTAALTAPCGLSLVEAFERAAVTTGDRRLRGEGETPTDGPETDCSAPFFNTPTEYVIHAWKEKAVDFVAAIEAYDEGLVKEAGPVPATRYYWIDIFAVAQNEKTLLSKSEYVSDLSALVAGRVLGRGGNGPYAERACYVWGASPRQPRALRRVWCMFELYAWVYAKRPVRVAVSRDTLKKLKRDPNAARLALQSLATIEGAASREEDYVTLHNQLEQRLTRAGTFVSFGNYDAATGRGDCLESNTGHVRLDTLLRNVLMKGLAAAHIGCRFKMDKIVSYELRKHDEAVVCLAAVGKRSFVSGSFDGTLILWDAYTREATERTDPADASGNVSALAGLGPDLFASGSADPDIKVWHTNNLELVRTLRGGTRRCRALCYLGRHGEGNVQYLKLVNEGKDGERELDKYDNLAKHRANLKEYLEGRVLASADSDVIRIWDVFGEKQINTLRGHNSFVSCLANVPNTHGRRLASGSDDTSVRVWDWLSGDIVACLYGHDGEVSSIVSPLPGMIASGSADETVRMWNLTTGEVAYEIGPAQGSHGKVAALAATQDGQLITGRAFGNSGVIRVYNSKTGQLLRVLSGHSDWVRSLAFVGKEPTNEDPREEILASGSSDTAVRLWEIAPAVGVADIDDNDGEDDGGGDTLPPIADAESLFSPKHQKAHAALSKGPRLIAEATEGEHDNPRQMDCYVLNVYAKPQPLPEADSDDELPDAIEWTPPAGKPPKSPGRGVGRMGPAFNDRDMGREYYNDMAASEASLKEAFDAADARGGGGISTDHKISHAEVKQALRVDDAFAKALGFEGALGKVGKHGERAEFETMLIEADEDEDKTISFIEFRKVAHRLKERRRRAELGIDTSSKAAAARPASQASVTLRIPAGANDANRGEVMTVSSHLAVDAWQSPINPGIRHPFPRRNWDSLDPQGSAHRAPEEKRAAAGPQIRVDPSLLPFWEVALRAIEDRFVATHAAGGSSGWPSGALEEALQWLLAALAALAGGGSAFGGRAPIKSRADSSRDRVDYPLDQAVKRLLSQRSFTDYLTGDADGAVAHAVTHTEAAHLLGDNQWQRLNAHSAGLLRMIAQNSKPDQPRVTPDEDACRVLATGILERIVGSDDSDALASAFKPDVVALDLKLCKETLVRLGRPVDGQHREACCRSIGRLGVDRWPETLKKPLSQALPHLVPPSPDWQYGSWDFDAEKWKSPDGSAGAYAWVLLLAAVAFDGLFQPHVGKTLTTLDDSRDYLRLPVKAWPKVFGMPWKRGVRDAAKQFDVLRGEAVFFDGEKLGQAYGRLVADSRWFTVRRVDNGHRKGPGPEDLLRTVKVIVEVRPHMEIPDPPEGETAREKARRIMKEPAAYTWASVAKRSEKAWANFRGKVLRDLEKGASGAFGEADVIGAQIDRAAAYLRDLGDVPASMLAEIQFITRPYKELRETQRPYHAWLKEMMPRDTPPPRAPTPPFVKVVSGGDVLELEDPLALTRDATVMGTATRFSTVALSLDGKVVFSKKVTDKRGSWECDVKGLADGPHELSAACSTADAESPPTVRTLTVDTRPPNKVEVEVVSARNLARTELLSFSLPDPRCYLSCNGGASEVHTKTVSGSDTPDFGGERFEMAATSPDASIAVRLVDVDLLTKNDPLGCAAVPMRPLLHKRWVTKWHTLRNADTGDAMTGKGGKKKSEVRIRARWVHDEAYAKPPNAMIVTLIQARGLNHTDTTGMFSGKAAPPDARATCAIGKAKAVSETAPKGDCPKWNAALLVGPFDAAAGEDLVVSLVDVDQTSLNDPLGETRIPTAAAVNRARTSFAGTAFVKWYPLVEAKTGRPVKGGAGGDTPSEVEVGLRAVFDPAVGS